MSFSVEKPMDGGLTALFTPQDPTPSLPIARPPWTQLGKDIESRVRKALHDYQMLEGLDSLSIALSGGKDSLTLLFLIHGMMGRGLPKLNLHAIHVDGEFSCGPGINLGYLQGICKELGINFIRAESNRKREELECYSCSRERRRLIFNAAKEVGAPTVAFGHHRDDSVQTLLLNLLHKAEFEANLPLVKMHDYGVTIIRPLIFVTENEIKEFAKMYRFTRITCMCPVGQDSKRKRADLLLQKLEEEFPHARKNLFHAAQKYGTQKAAKKSSD
jgi:tRNA 2-thiocytidine biosynthesis protein TtcA